MYRSVGDPLWFCVWISFDSKLSGRTSLLLNNVQLNIGIPSRIFG